MQVGAAMRCCRSVVPRMSGYVPRLSRSRQATPYLRLPIQFATSLKNRILDGGLMSRSELDEAIVECERVASNTQTIGTTFVVMQVRGRKPA